MIPGHWAPRPDDSAWTPRAYRAWAILFASMTAMLAAGIVLLCAQGHEALSLIFVPAMTATIYSGLHAFSRSRGAA